MPAPHDPLPVSPATYCVSAGRPEPAPGAPVNPPIVLSSTFARGGDTAYGREANPTWSAFEEAVGGLEGGRALVYSSGMAAADAALALVPEGGLVVAPNSAYMGVLQVLTERAAAGRIVLRTVDLAETATARELIPQAALVWLESPSNPLLEVADLPALIAAARESGAVSVVDNTFATPLGSRPLALGADVVLHSATKYLSGHSDLILGVLVTPETDRGREHHEALSHHRHLAGAIAGPLETWLALRGLRTLALRFERASATAADLAGRLAGNPTVTRVRYPGSGAMLAIEVTGGAEAADALCAGVRLWSHSTSLGGVESQLERRRSYPSEPASVPESLVRLSVGIEDVEDLWADLARALPGGAV